MFEPELILWYVPVLPLLGAILTVIVGAYAPKLSHVPALLGAAGAAVVSLFLITVLPGDNPVLGTGTSHSFTWFEAGSLKITASLYYDSLTAIMLLGITFIGAWIVVFSIGYIHDEGYTRYFAVVSLFIFSMCLLVMADNFLLLFAGWEGVGVCSYLLVGYWYKKPSAADAARKAFLVTRLGDVGFILGIFLLASHGGMNTDIRNIIDRAVNGFGKTNPEIIDWACILLFCGAVGKSAQFPLYVWLPDTGVGAHPCGDDGDGGRLSARTLCAAVRRFAVRANSCCIDGGNHCDYCGLHRTHTVRSQASVGLLDRESVGLHVYGARLCGTGESATRRDGGDLPPVHTRILQSGAVPVRR
jgi:formate hydrogenlyase subunit 3/multisubunit Na+/H+ antiporter MnhD subunit